ncbi:MAG: hypothetical protein CV088_07075 [Nitrospira sp. LK70]|nr:hypothetical protein [Nitrospira sp. LK70]
MDAKKKTILAASLIFLWVGLVVWQGRSQQEIVRVPLTNVTGHPSSLGRHVEKSGTGLRVNLDLLASMDLQLQANFTGPRNIFSVPRPDGTFVAGNASASLDQSGSGPVEILRQQEDAVELEQFRYLGFLRLGESRRKNRDIAVLKRDDEVLVLRIDDRVDDHLILKAINSESVTIRNTETHTDQTVPLSEELSEEPAKTPTGQE